jgi:hypothetical protein
MAHVKMCTRYALMAVGGLAFFTACSGVAWQAAGAAVSLGSYAVSSR